MEQDRVSELDVVPQEETGEQPPPPGKILPITLFLATVFTTLWAGAYQERVDHFHPFLGAFKLLWEKPLSLLDGVPFSATLLAILVTHEFGHYILSRIHRVPSSLPLFIPGLPLFVGTFGAVIRMRAPILSRKALFDIGVSGPIAGFAVALVALVIGIRLSSPIRLSEVTNDVALGSPLLFDFFAWVLLDPVPSGYTLNLHPVAVAAWFGLFITFLNLIPIGQLDGGHVAYALFGRHQTSLVIAVIPILIVLGLVGWQGWLLWAGLAGLLGFTHPPVRDPQAILGRTRIWIAWGVLAIFVLTFTPVPIIVPR